MADQHVCRSAGKSGPQGLPDDRSARLSARSGAAWRSVERSALLYLLSAGNRALLGRGSVTTPPFIMNFCRIRPKMGPQLCPKRRIPLAIPASNEFNELHGPNKPQPVVPQRLGFGSP